jgi:hypothetical protein
VSSRLERTSSGRVVAVVIMTPLPELDAGYRFRVLGNEIGDSGFRFTGEPTGRAPLPEETPKRTAAIGTRSTPRKWSDGHREQARRLQAGGGLSHSQIALEVCGDKRFKSTVQLWLRQQQLLLPGRATGP